MCRLRLNSHPWCEKGRGDHLVTEQSPLSRRPSLSRAMWPLVPLAVLPCCSHPVANNNASACGMR